MWLIVMALVLNADAANCKKGKPCGDSCIAVDKTCHVGRSSGSSTTTRKAASSTSKADTKTSSTPTGPVDLMYEVTESSAGRLVLRSTDTDIAVACRPLEGCAVPATGVRVFATDTLYRSWGVDPLLSYKDSMQRWCKVTKCEMLDEE